MKKLLFSFVFFLNLTPAYSAVHQLSFANGTCQFACANEEHEISTEPKNCPAKYEYAGGWCSGSADNGGDCIAKAHKACPSIYFNGQGMVPGTVDSWDFHPVESIPGVPGPPEPSECSFQCTGVSVFGCPYAFEEVSNTNEPLECYNGDFNLVPVDGNHCHQFALDTCRQTLTPYVGASNTASGKIGEDGSLPPQTPTPPASTQPYTASQSMDDFSCLQYHPQMQLYYWIPGCFNPLLGTAQQNPTQLVNPLIHVQSIIGPQGEMLDSDQFFYNMAIEQLKAKKNLKIEVKK